ncbi:MAG: hypothetical protein ABFC94_05475 [Syntrophomonas sp.]
MSQTFKWTFAEFIWRRIEVTNNCVLKSPQRIKYSEEEEIALHNLKAVIPANMHELILDYEAAITAGMSCEIEYAYKQGMKDGIKLRQELILDDEKVVL